MVFVVGGTVFVVDEMVIVAGGMLFAMDGAVLLQNRRPATCQPAAPPPASPPPSLRFRCIWVKRLLQAGVALYTRAV